MIDFGTGARLPEWSGVVRSRSGAPVGKGTVTVRHADTGSEVAFSTTPAGQFSFRLIPGVYTEVSWRPSGRQKRDAIAFDVVEVPHDDFAQDLVIEGTRLFGRIVDRTGSLGTTVDYPLVYVRRADAKMNRPARTARPGTDGSWEIDGLEAGRWVVWTSSGQLVAAGVGDLIVSIDDADIDVRQDLEIH